MMGCLHHECSMSYVDKTCKGGDKNLQIFAKSVMWNA